jgi:hypothetical protein
MHAPAGIWIAATAAIALVLGAVAAILWPAANRQARGRVARGLAAWLALDLAIGAVAGFAATTHRQIPALALGIVVPVAAGLWLLGRDGALRRVADSLPLRALIGVQVYRVAGVVFLIAWPAGILPAAFAIPAGVGDVLVGITAPFVAARVDAGTERSRRLALAWNATGIADLVVAVSLGAMTSPTPLWPVAFSHANPAISRLPLVLIPTLAVPLSVLLHIVTLRRLRAPRRVGGAAAVQQGAAR